MIVPLALALSLWSGAAESGSALLPTLPAPLLEIIAADEATCRPLALLPSAVHRRDLTGDGSEDIVLDFANDVVSCPRAMGEFCGAIGCRLVVWIGDPGPEGRVVFDQAVKDFRLAGPGEGPPLATQISGRNCDLPRERSCIASYIIGPSGRLVPAAEPKAGRFGIGVRLARSARD